MVDLVAVAVDAEVGCGLLGVDGGGWWWWQRAERTNTEEERLKAVRCRLRWIH